VIKFVTDLWQLSDFLLFSPSNNNTSTDSNEKSEIFLKVTLNTTLSHKVVVYGVHLTMDEIRTQNYHDYSCDGH
jgi:hypothetical protein